MSFQWDVLQKLFDLTQEVDSLREDINDCEKRLGLLGEIVSQIEEKQKAATRRKIDPELNDRIRRIEQYVALTDQSKRFFWEDPHMLGFFNSCMAAERSKADKTKDLTHEDMEVTKVSEDH